MPVAGLWTLPDVVNAVVNDRAAKNAGSNQKAQKDVSCRPSSAPSPI
jgi:hypothetical protein